MTAELSKKIEEFIVSNGFETGVYGKYCGCQHSCGLPTGIKVRPDWSPIDGSHTVVVTEDKVHTCHCNTPYYHRDWHTVGTESYETQAELLEILERRTKPPQNCW